MNTEWTQVRLLNSGHQRLRWHLLKMHLHWTCWDKCVAAAVCHRPLLKQGPGFSVQHQWGSNWRLGWALLNLFFSHRHYRKLALQWPVPPGIKKAARWARWLPSGLSLTVCHLRAAVWGEPVAEQIRDGTTWERAGGVSINTGGGWGSGLWWLGCMNNCGPGGLIWSGVTHSWPPILFKMESQWTHLPFWNICKIPPSLQVLRFICDTAESSVCPKVCQLHALHRAQRFDSAPVKPSHAA